MTNANTSGNIRSNRPRHTKKEVEAAVVELEARGIRLDVRLNGHVWARAYCPCKDGTHQLTVYNSPQNPGNHGKNVLATANRWQVQHQEAARQKRKGDEKR